MTYVWMDHAEHDGWRQVGRCVYCGCGARLYNGKVPPNEQERQKLLKALDTLYDRIAGRPSKDQGDVS